LDEVRRDMERRRLVMEQVRQIEDARLERLKQAPKAGPNAGSLQDGRDSNPRRRRRQAAEQGA
jgi:hypothetical protein